MESSLGKLNGAMELSLPSFQAKANPSARAFETRLDPALVFIVLYYPNHFIYCIP